MRTRSAFSLVELSIVLVILGLLVGGILGGKSLIRASELRTVGVEHQKYFSAVQAFRDKYFGLPGDINNATQIWGTAAVGMACMFTAGTGTQTCDGDANGRIDVSSATSMEMFRAWQQLANAGMIEGQYNGIGEAPRPKVTTSTNAWWILYYQGTMSGNGFYFDGAYNNSLVLPQLLLPEEAWNIDTKLDDGKPATGKIAVYSTPTIPTCTDGANSAALTANYLLTGTSKTCGLAFRQQF